MNRTCTPQPIFYVRSLNIRSHPSADMPVFTNSLSDADREGRAFCMDKSVVLRVCNSLLGIVTLVCLLVMTHGPVNVYACGEYVSSYLRQSIYIR